MDPSEEGDLVKEPKYIVFGSCLRELFGFVSCNKPSCQGKCTVIKRTLCGTLVSIEFSCEKGHLFTWRSQPYIRASPALNVMLPGAILFSGASPAKALNVFKFLNIVVMTSRTYHRMQRAFLVPAIDNLWRWTQAEVWRQLQGEELRVAGDARCCSPGHTAKYGSYTLMDATSGYVLDVQLIQVCVVD